MVASFLHRVGELHLEIAVFLVQRRDGDAHRGLILVVGLGQHQFERQVGAVRQQRLHFEAVAAPLALQAGDQRALERGMRFLFEQIHERRAGEGVVLGIAEQLEPRAIRIHDDAFLHVGDGIGRAFEKVLQLLAVFARRGQRGRQRALQAMGAQFAAWRPPAGGCDWPASPRPGSPGASHRRSPPHRRARARSAPACPGALCCLTFMMRGEIDAELLDEGNQHFRIDLRQGVARGRGRPAARCNAPDGRPCAACC